MGIGLGHACIANGPLDAHIIDDLTAFVHYQSRIGYPSLSPVEHYPVKSVFLNTGKTGMSGRRKP